MDVKEIQLDEQNSLFCYNFNKKESVTLEDVNIKIICKSTGGGGNLLVLERNKNLKQSFTNCTINFNGDNSIIFIRTFRSKNSYVISIHKNNTFYLGENNYFNPLNKSILIISEGKNIIIGNDCIFSYGLTFRTADPHLIYSCDSKARINPSKSIFIGDHVWIGQDSLILKGATIGSGTIFGGHSVITGKKHFSNCVYGGNPTKLLKRNVFFRRPCVNNYGRQQTADSMYFDKDDFIFNKTEEHIDRSDFMHSIDEALCNAESAWERFEILMEKIVHNDDKYRFVIQEPRVQERDPAPKGFLHSCASAVQGLFRSRPS